MNINHHSPFFAYSPQPNENVAELADQETPPPSSISVDQTNINPDLDVEGRPSARLPNQEISQVNKLWQAYEKGDITEFESELKKINKSRKYIPGAKNGFCYLHHAAKNDNIEMMKVILKYEQNVNIKTNSQATALQIAAQRNHHFIVKMLIEHRDIHLNKVNHTGSTALHLACYNFCYESIELILDSKKVDINIKRKDNQTALDIFLKKHDTILIKSQEVAFDRILEMFQSKNNTLGAVTPEGYNSERISAAHSESVPTKRKRNYSELTESPQNFTNTLKSSPTEIALVNTNIKNNYSCGHLGYKIKILDLSLSLFWMKDRENIKLDDVFFQNIEQIKYTTKRIEKLLEWSSSINLLNWNAPLEKEKHTNKSQNFCRFFIEPILNRFNIPLDWTIPMVSSFKYSASYVDSLIKSSPDYQEDVLNMAKNDDCEKVQYFKNILNKRGHISKTDKTSKLLTTPLGEEKLSFFTALLLHKSKKCLNLFTKARNSEFHNQEYFDLLVSPKQKARLEQQYGNKTVVEIFHFIILNNNPPLNDDEIIEPSGEVGVYEEIVECSGYVNSDLYPKKS